jgi:hypothetical protein
MLGSVSPTLISFTPTGEPSNSKVFFNLSDSSESFMAPPFRKYFLIGTRFGVV